MQRTVLREPRFWRRPVSLLHRIGMTVLALTFAIALAGAAEPSGPLPRFASLRADQVNLRTGPGENYPIEWVFSRKGMPVEVIAEYDIWRKVRDWQGNEGWVHERMLSGARAIIVRDEVRSLHSDPDPASPMVARAEPGVIARLLECEGPWCRVQTHEEGHTDISGWLRRAEIWGVYPEEEIR